MDWGEIIGNSIAAGVYGHMISGWLSAQEQESEFTLSLIIRRDLSPYMFQPDAVRQILHQLQGMADNFGDIDEPELSKCVARVRDLLQEVAEEMGIFN